MFEHHTPGRCESKLAYMLMLDLLPLSKKNNWINEKKEDLKQRYDKEFVDEIVSPKRYLQTMIYNSIYEANTKLVGDMRYNFLCILKQISNLIGQNTNHCPGTINDHIHNLSRPPWDKQLVELITNGI